MSDAQPLQAAWTDVRWPGAVVASSDENDLLLSKKVFLVPSRGWDSDPQGPESR